MEYPTPPANMPAPVETDVRIKVVFYYYKTEEQARIASEYFRELAAYKLEQGYDFGFNAPGFGGYNKRLDAWLAVSP